MFVSKSSDKVKHKDKAQSERFGMYLNYLAVVWEWMNSFQARGHHSRSMARIIGHRTFSLYANCLLKRC